MTLDPTLSDRVVAGVVGRPHGLDGSFHVVAAVPALLSLGATVHVAGSERRVERRAGTDEHPILRVTGCADRDGAEALRGQELSAAGAEVPALGEDEWWARDLEGCAVVDGARPVGSVVGLIGLPSCEALQVRTNEEGAAVLLVPLVRDAVRRIDVEARRIDIDLAFLGVE